MYIQEAVVLAIQYNCCIRRKGRGGFKLKPVFKQLGKGYGNGFMQIMDDNAHRNKDTSPRWVPNVSSLIANDWMITV